MCHKKLTGKCMRCFLDTFVVHLLPAKLVSANHRKHIVITLFGDHLQGISDVIRVEAWRRGLNMTHDVHL